jgi:hypothetical protein
VKTIQIGEYEIKELLLGQMRAIQKKHGTDDIQYHIAGETITKNGVPIGVDGLDQLPLSIANQLLMAVADLNTPEGEQGKG